MKHILSTALLGAVLSSTTNAFELPDMQELEGYYYDAQFTLLTTDVNNANGSGDSQSSAAQLTLGRTAYEDEDWANIDVETFAIFGLEETTAFRFNSDNNRYRSSLTYGFGLQASVRRTVYEDFAANIKLGLAHIKAKAFSEVCAASVCAANGKERSSSGIGLTYGISGLYNLSEDSSVSFGYQHFFDDNIAESKVKITGISIGYTSNF